MKTYTELMKLKTYEERFMYLRETAKVGDRTFGGYRYLNNMPVQIKFLDKRKNIMAKINFNDYGIPEFDDFKQIK